jgi:hypothetical protein
VRELVEREAETIVQWHVGPELVVAAAWVLHERPHSSAVKGADRLRELRPRGGRSPWRALCRQVGDVFVVATVAPEAQVDGRKFDAACRAAERRLSQIEEE